MLPRTHHIRVTIQAVIGFDLKTQALGHVGCFILAMLLLVGSWSCTDAQWSVPKHYQQMGTTGNIQEKTLQKRQETFHEDWKILCQMELLTNRFIAHPPAQAASFAGIDVRDGRFIGIGRKEWHPTFEALHRNHHLGSRFNGARD